MEQYEKNILKAALTAAVESKLEVLKQEPVDFDKYWKITQKESKYYMELTGTTDKQSGNPPRTEPVNENAGLDRLRRTDK
jgi:hypothetical protein